MKREWGKYTDEQIAFNDLKHALETALGRELREDEEKLVKWLAGFGWDTVGQFVDICSEKSQRRKQNKHFVFQNLSYFHHSIEGGLHMQCPKCRTGVLEAIGTFSLEEGALEVEYYQPYDRPKDAIIYICSKDECGYMEMKAAPGLLRALKRKIRDRRYAELLPGNRH